MFTRHRKARVLFGLSDIVITALAFEAAYQTRSLLPLEHLFFLTVQQKALVLGFSLMAWVAIGVWLEIYEKLDAGHPRIILRDSFRQCVYGGVSLILFEYVLRMELSRPFLILFSTYAWVLLLLFRLTAGRVVGVIRREFAAPLYVMVVGVGERARRMGMAVEESAAYGVRLRGFFSEQGDSGETQLAGLYPVHPISELPAFLRKHVVDELIFAVGSESLAELEEVFLLCDEEGVRTRIAVDFFPHVHSTVSLDRFGVTPLLTFTAAPDDEIRLLVKRATDVAIAMAGLAVLAPFMALIALAIRLTSTGPAVFKQVRCGLNGRRFVFYKFRSMVENAEELKSSLAHLNEKDEVAFKIADDPRLTLVGRYLRKFSIDEWPQLWNVLRGDMSLVGPRPAVPSEVDQYQRWQRRRLRMRPGLTCLWAISGRDNLDFETWMKMDMQYIDNWSLALDWKIILRTIPHVLTGHGAN
jgi:exopolysaccharide biosynthesis polyprenyl glycosylphosphotransferase